MSVSVKTVLFSALGMSLLGLPYAEASQKASSQGESYNLKLKLKQETTLHRIIGGKPSTKGERPWMAALTINGQQFCGGSLIDKQWVLTAAHCIEDIQANEMSGFNVRLNVNDLANANEGETIAVAAMYSHASYSEGAAADIALLKLAKPATVDPIAIADSDFMNSHARPGTSTTVSGWGNRSSSGSDFSSKLHQVSIPLVSREQCNGPKAYNGQIADTEICAGLAAGGKDSCQGDSGGPLVANRQGKPVQLGVVSWGDGCAEPNKYGVYARVASFTQWVSQVKSGQVAGGGNSGGGTPNPVPPTGGMLESGRLVHGLSDQNSGLKHFSIHVPQGARILWVDIKGNNGDADLYLKYGGEVTESDYDHAPLMEGSVEKILLRNPKPGVWHIAVGAFHDYEGLELMAFTR